MIQVRKGSDPKSFHLSWVTNRGNKRVETFKTAMSKLKEHPFAPEEASWFYVNELSFQNLSERDHASHDEVLDGSLMSLFSGGFSNNIVNRNPPGINGLSGTDKKFTTVVDGKVLERELLDEVIVPQTDNWIRSFPVSEGINSLIGRRTYSGATVLSYIIDFYPPMSNLGTGNYDIHDIFAGGFKPPYGPQVNISLINYPFIYKRDLEVSHGVTGIPSTLNDEFGRPHRATGIGIPYIGDRGVNLLKYTNAPFNTVGSGREEEEFQKTSGDYTKKLIRNRQINIIMELAQGLTNPFYSTSLIFRMIDLIGDSYMSYVDEKAREADGLNNYFGHDVHSPHRRNSPTDGRYNYSMKTGETLSLSIPTKKIYYTEDNQRLDVKHGKDVTVPINKLYKGFEEFELDLLKHFRNLKHGYETIKDIKITPYMEGDVIQEIINKENQREAPISRIYR